MRDRTLLFCISNVRYFCLTINHQTKIINTQHMEITKDELQQVLAALPTVKPGTIKGEMINKIDFAPGQKFIFWYDIGREDWVTDIQI